MSLCNWPTLCLALPGQASGPSMATTLVALTIAAPNTDWRLGPPGPLFCPPQQPRYSRADAILGFPPWSSKGQVGHN